jgi:hypothetical protein
MSSSKSSEEDVTAKKSAKEIVEEVRGRAAKMAATTNSTNGHTSEEHSIDDLTDAIQTPKHARARSITFASIIIDSAHGFKVDPASYAVSPTALISGPARPQTSVADQLLSPVDDSPAAVVSSMPSMSSKLALIRQESRTSTLKKGSDQRPSVLNSLSSWLSWGKPTNTPTGSDPDLMKRVSNAEGSLRELLKAADGDRKGKGVDRTT